MRLCPIFFSVDDMKLRIRRHDLDRVLNFYNEQLAQMFGPLILSPAQRVRAARQLRQLQEAMQAQERTNVWQAPLVLEVFDDGRFYVRLEDERQVLVMD